MTVRARLPKCASEREACAELHAPASGFDVPGPAIHRDYGVHPALLHLVVADQAEGCDISQERSGSPLHAPVAVEQVEHVEYVADQLDRVTLP